ncbi:peptidoglycan-binding protein [Streptomyces sp. NPDC050504]|uniref:peptidoglycan-binding protein n=1 Tax=Streptomyces sp. NPDC050504 TaxID=3365618 RepID=UPI0037A13434
MDSPLFVETPPEADCVCTGCTYERVARRGAPWQGGAPARTARKAAVLVAAVGTVVGGGEAAVAAVPGTGTPVQPSADAAVPGQRGGPGAGHGVVSTPQGEVSGMRGGSRAEARVLTRRSVTRQQVLDRAQRWVDQRVPYSMSHYWSDGYRQDCSGFVSMAWGLGSSQTTWTLPSFATRITKDQLRPGDILVYNNPANPAAGSHVTLFGGWTDSSRTRYTAYEQTRPNTLKRATPYAYWNNSSGYVPYRYNGISEDGGNGGGGNGGGGNGGGAAFPGAGSFGPGASNAHVTRLGRMLVARGGGRFYTSGPGPVWTQSDRRATEAFQRAQGWSGSEADGMPGPHTWSLLVGGGGRDIGSGGGGGGGGGSTGFPGAGNFRPGQSNDHVLRLGQRLVAKGYGRHYSVGPSRAWSESDRRNVEDFQRARGWRGAEADGYPGPHTWRLLFG